MERLPEKRLQEILDFVGYIRAQEQKLSEDAFLEDLDPRKDPLLKFIGGASHGALARIIDSELYGDTR